MVLLLCFSLVISVLIALIFKSSETRGGFCPLATSMLRNITLILIKDFAQIGTKPFEIATNIYLKICKHSQISDPICLVFLLFLSPQHKVFLCSLCRRSKYNEELRLSVSGMFQETVPGPGWTGEEPSTLPAAANCYANAPSLMTVANKVEHRRLLWQRTRTKFITPRGR